ncbi:MAG: hypothetical protein PHT23_01300 [Bacteroidales bacterium]|nr:hypothetical protein [Bacteroidales bacterium]
MNNFEILGIALKNRDIVEKGPKSKLETTAAELAGQTNGKLFVAIKDNNPDIPNALALKVNGFGFAIRQNESWMQTNTAQPDKKGVSTLAFDFPMRLVDGVKKPATYKIQFIKGYIENEQFVEDGTFNEYTLIITQDELPTPVYDQKIDGE